MHTVLRHIIFIAALLAALPPHAIGEPNPMDATNNALQQLGIELSGTVEIEAAYEDTDNADSSDITLATVELGILAKPVKHFSGQIVFLFEEDDTDPVEVDQGFIRIDGEEKCPFYSEAGRLYLPFGRFDSHFITDPPTLELGETRETALVAGYTSSVLEVSFAAFNGDVNEADEADDMIDGLSAAALFSMPRLGAITLTAGVSYLSNIADSDALTDQLTTPETVTDNVPAMAAFVTAGWSETLFATLEYVTVMDHFTAGDVTFDGGSEAEPWALNAELAYAIGPKVEIGVRYAATGDAGAFLPETQYGAVVNYEPVDHVGVGMEVLKGEFEDGSDSTTVTAQLALAF